MRRSIEPHTAAQPRPAVAATAAAAAVGRRAVVAGVVGWARWRLGAGWSARWRSRRAVGRGAPAWRAVGAVRRSPARRARRRRGRGGAPSASRARCRRWPSARAAAGARRGASAARPSAASVPGRGAHVGDVAGGRHDHAALARPRARIRSPERQLRRPRLAASRSGARASPAVSTARPMPALSFSSETCMKTIPPSAIPISQIHARPRSSAVDQAVVGQRADASKRRCAAAARLRAAAARGAAGRGAAVRAAGAGRRRGAARAGRRPRSRARVGGGGLARGDRHHAAGASSSLRAARRRADFARGLAATSPGVGDDRAAADQLGLGLAAADADRQVGRADAAARAVGEEALDAPVLERVEGDGGQPAAGRSSSQAQRQRRVELAELVVDRDAQRLEGALGGVAAGEARGRGDRARVIASTSSKVVSSGARSRRRTISPAMRSA